MHSNDDGDHGSDGGDGRKQKKKMLDLYTTKPLLQQLGLRRIFVDRFPLQQKDTSKVHSKKSVDLIKISRIRESNYYAPIVIPTPTTTGC